MFVRFALSLLATVLIVSIGVARAEDTAPEPGATPPAIVLASGEADIGDIVIDEVARRLIQSYYQDSYDDYVQVHGESKKKNKNKNKRLPPGLAKRGELPPGLAKQLTRKGHLPPGLDKRDLPPDLLSQLPPIQPDYRYLVVDDKVMLVRRATNVILDVLTVAAIDLLN